MKAYGKYAIITFLILSCFKGEVMSANIAPGQSLDDLSASSWGNLAQKKIFFGHQSVGDNIIQGMNELMKEYPVLKLDIKKTRKPENFEKGIFAHFPIGKNEDASSKIDDFDRALRSGIGERVDIAFFKFCFVDIKRETDIQELFGDYKRTMSSLKLKYPGVIFVHVTVPLLRKEKSSPKSWLKKLVGKEDGFFSKEHNVKRNGYNELLRKEYTGKEPVFDLAAVESTYQDGSRETFTEGGKTYYSLVPQYTEDGGHLNKSGRARAAGQMLIFLAGLK